MLENLYSEPVPPFDELVEQLPADPLAVRKLLIALAQLQREHERVKDTRMLVVHEYDNRLVGIEARIKDIRSSLQTFITEHNNNEKVSFPEVGTAFLRKTKPSLVVQDDDVFKEWAVRLGFVKEVPDLTGAKKQALEDGEVPPGAVLLPERFELTVRL